jgi:hypothetical protein
MFRWVEFASGVLAALIGVVVALLAQSLGAAFWAVGLLFVMPVAVGIGAYQHAWHHREVWLRVLWVSSLLLLCMTFLTMFTVGVYLLPAALLALVASILGSVRSATRLRATRV